MIKTPVVMPYSHHVYHVYAVRTGDRTTLQQHLSEQGIQIGIHYPIPVHLQPAYSDLGYQPGAFPHTELAAQEVLSLPMYPELTPEQINEVAQSLHDLL